jgi:hypothetical protein
MSVFIESECEFGGCACPIWNDWWWAAVEAAQIHPDTAEMQSLYEQGVITDEGLLDDHIDAVAHRLISDELHVFEALACVRRSCPRYQPQTTNDPNYGALV